MVDFIKFESGAKIERVLETNKSYYNDRLVKVWIYRAPFGKSGILRMFVNLASELVTEPLTGMDLSHEYIVMQGVSGRFYTAQFDKFLNTNEGYSELT